MNIQTKIQQPEGRRLEFKKEIPTNAELAKTIVSFANDAGGELFIGIKNNHVLFHIKTLEIYLKH